MPTECSAVSDLIQRVHAPRLRTEPGDELLFLNANGQGPRVPPRLMEPPRAAIPSEIRHPTAPRERRTWPFVVAAVLAGAIGITGVMYGKRVFDRDDPVSAVVALPAIAPVAPPTVSAPPESKPSAPLADSAQLAPAPPAVDQTVPAAEPTRETASKSPSPRTHRRAKSKRVAKHANKNRRPASTPAKESARNPPALRVESPAPARKQRQSGDDENPL